MAQRTRNAGEPNSGKVRRKERPPCEPGHISNLPFRVHSPRWDQPRRTRWPALSRLPGAFVHVAFYDWAGKDMLPDYQVGLRYWENGVADDMTTDFGEFVMHAAMTQFAPQPRRC